MSGASATFGTALNATSSGENIRSTGRHAAIARPMSTPTSTDSAKPRIVEYVVCQASVSRTWR